MVDLGVTLVLLGEQKFLELTAISMYVGQVEGSKVLVEWSIGQVIIDIEEEGVRDILRR